MATQNMYVGTEFQHLAAASSLEELLGAIDEEFEFVQRTDPEARVDAMAAELARLSPQLVALQEVARWWREDALEHDFLARLLAGLAARGAQYRVASALVVAEVPMRGASGRVYRLENRDVVLAAAGVEVGEPRSGLFAAAHQVSAAGLPPVRLTRGWASCRTNIDGSQFRFFCTHLEEATHPEPQLAQAEELLGAVAGELPAVVAGDFNSSADGGDLASPAYERLLAGGLEDAWRVAATEREGGTWGQALDLRNESSTLSERLDLVLLRGAARALSISRFGHRPEDRTAAGVWPSDHAGLVADLEVD